MLGELVVGIILGNLALAGIGVFEPLKTAPFLPIAAEIFASVGHTVLVAGTPVLSDATFSAVIAMVMFTTLVTPPLLKAAFAKSSHNPLRRGAGSGG